MGHKVSNTDQLPRMRINKRLIVRPCTIILYLHHMGERDVPVGLHEVLEFDILVIILRLKLLLDLRQH